MKPRGPAQSRWTSPGWDGLTGSDPDDAKPMGGIETKSWVGKLPCLPYVCQLVCALWPATWPNK